MHGLEDDRRTAPLLTVGGVEFAAIDFESAGTAPGLTDEPVQIAVVHLVDGEIRPGFSSYLRPSRPVTWAAASVHGLTDDLLASAPALNDLWPQVRGALRGRWLVAHGAATEKRFLRAFPLHGFGPWIDTLALTRKLYPSLPSHALGDVVASLGLSDSPELSGPGFRWHDAVCDAAASLVILRHVIDAAGLANAPATTLLALSGRE